MKISTSEANKAPSWSQFILNRLIIGSEKAAPKIRKKEDMQKTSIDPFHEKNLYKAYFQSWKVIYYLCPEPSSQPQSLPCPCTPLLVILAAGFAIQTQAVMDTPKHLQSCTQKMSSFSY